MSNREITDKLFIRVGTVKTHVHNIVGKLGVGGRPRAIARARELELIPWRTRLADLSVILYGSQARSDSDIDVLVVARDGSDYGDLIPPHFGGRVRLVGSARRSDLACLRAQATI